MVSTPEQRAKWRATHHARRDKERKFYQDHRDEILKQGKQYRQTHKKQIAKRAKKYVQTHREQFNTYQRKYQHEHISLIRIRKREKLRKLKKWVVDKLGRKCVDCGLVSEYDCIYDLHHINEEESWARKGRKSNMIDCLRIRELKRWKKEDKIPDDVKLLCANCHRIKHHGDSNE